MQRLIALALLVWPTASTACDRPVCRVDPASLELPQELGFDDQPSSRGPGRLVSGVLDLNGASFGERFAGQSLSAEEMFDTVDGAADAPLTLMPGAAGQNLTVLRLSQGNALSGDGPAGYPKQEATGEGAIAILFTRDQGAVRLWLRGGEGGAATILFMDRDGTVIDSHAVAPLAEEAVGFAHEPGRIAGLVVTNTDPEGIALDQVDFGAADRFSGPVRTARTTGRTG